jgi:hypothetical protein
MHRSPCSRVAALSPNPTRYDVAKKDLYRLEPLREVVQWLLCKGDDRRGPPMDRFQPPGSITLSAGDDHVDVSEAKLSRPSLLRGLGRYRDQHPDSLGPCSWGRSKSWRRPCPLKRRSRHPLGESTRTHFQVFVPISASQRIHVPAQGLGCAHSAPQGATLLEDVVRWEANRVYSEWLQARNQRRREWCAARAATRAWGEDTPSEPESSGGEDEEEDKDGEEEEVTPPPHSPPCEALPSLGDIFSRWARITIGARQSKWPRAETGPSTGLPPQPCITLVSSSMQGIGVVPMLTKATHIFGVLQVPSSLPAIGVDMSVMASSSSSSPEGAEPLSKKGHFTPDFKAKPDAYSMCAQESSSHTYYIENEYRITNVTIYNIYYIIMPYKRLSQTLSTAS